MTTLLEALAGLKARSPEALLVVWRTLDAFSARQEKGRRVKGTGMRATLTVFDRLLGLAETDRLPSFDSEQEIRAYLWVSVRHALESDRLAAPEANGSNGVDKHPGAGGEFDYVDSEADRLLLEHSRRIMAATGGVAVALLQALVDSNESIEEGARILTDCARRARTRGRSGKAPTGAADLRPLLPAAIITAASHRIQGFPDDKLAGYLFGFLESGEPGILSGSDIILPPLPTGDSQLGYGPGVAGEMRRHLEVLNHGAMLALECLATDVERSKGPAKRAEELITLAGAARGDISVVAAGAVLAGEREGAEAKLELQEKRRRDLVYKRRERVIAAHEALLNEFSATSATRRMGRIILTRLVGGRVTPT